MLTLSRREALLGLAGTIAATGAGSRAALAVAPAATEKRLVVIILRGAMDGLAVVPPHGDPALADLRQNLTPPGPGTSGGMRDLGGYFGLHPALAAMHALYAQNQVLICHAIAGSWRVRSHFEAQDYLECGATHLLPSGWLNRAIAGLHPGTARPEGLALAVGVGVPLLLRGPARAGSWAPRGPAMPQPELMARIAALAAPDPVIGPALTEGLRAARFADDAMAGAVHPEAEPRSGFALLAGTAGRLLAAPDGPRIAALELDGWDTHVAQARRLSDTLRALDSGLAALHEGLGAAWAQTAVLVMTEFGRTARQNGTGGTDHGTATAAFLLGGAIAGGRVRATWPGLGAGKLFQNRDLAPTADLAGLVKGVLAAHLGLPEAALQAAFPEARSIAPMTGLIRA